MRNAYSDRNDLQRKRLLALVASLHDDDLTRPVGAFNGTVGSYLAHLAFWDRRASFLLRRWKSEGIGPSLIDVDLLNDLLEEFLLAVPGRVAAAMAVSAAEEVDGEIAALSPELMQAIEAEGQTVRLDRAKHRDLHLTQIELVLERG